MKRSILPSITTLSLALVGSASAAERPNILWLTSEDHGPEMGCYGDPVARTPNVDSLAAKGMIFNHAWSNHPVCAPARTCPQTGQYATRCGVWRNGIGLPAGQPSLAGEAAPLIQEVVRHPSGQRWVLDEEIDQ